MHTAHAHTHTHTHTQIKQTHVNTRSFSDTQAQSFKRKLYTALTYLHVNCQALQRYTYAHTCAHRETHVHNAGNCEGGRWSSSPDVTNAIKKGIIITAFAWGSVAHTHIKKTDNWDMTKFKTYDQVLIYLFYDLFEQGWTNRREAGIEERREIQAAPDPSRIKLKLNFSCWIFTQ